MSINFEILDLRAFLAVFDGGSFHKAAALLNISQPALSRRIQALEARLGSAILERTTRRVTPTAAGSNLEPIARRLLEEIDSAIPFIEDAGEQRAGQITIASIPSAVVRFLPAVMRKFGAQFPLIRIRVLDRSPQESLDSVVHGEVEFGINLVGSTENDVAFTPFLDDPYVLACHRNHPLARHKTLNWRDLAGHALIRVGRPNSGNRAVLDAALSRANVQLDWRYEVNNLTTSLGLVEAGLGASVLPRLATPQHPHRSIVTIPLHRPQVTRTLGIVVRRNARLSSAATIFRDMLMSDWSVRAGTEDGRGRRRAPRVKPVARRAR